MVVMINQAPKYIKQRVVMINLPHLRNDGLCDETKGLVVMANLPHLRNEEDLRKMGKKLLVGGVEAQCCSGQGLTVHHWPRGGRR